MPRSATSGGPIRTEETEHPDHFDAGHDHGSPPPPAAARVPGGWKGALNPMMEDTYIEEAETPTVSEDPALGLPRRQKMEILFAVLLGLFLGALDQTIVGPALPTIVERPQRQRLLHLGRHDLPADEHDHASRSTASCPTSTDASRSA